MVEGSRSPEPMEEDETDPLIVVIRDFPDHVSPERRQEVRRQSMFNSRLSWRQIGFAGLLCFVNYCNFVCYSLIAPFFPKEAVIKGGSESLGAWVFGSYELTAFILSPLFGKYLNCLGPRFLFVTGLIVTGTACVLFGLLAMVENYSAFVTLAFLVRIVEAIGAAAYLTASYAIAAGEFPTRVATMQGLLETFCGLGISTGPTIGGALYTAGGYWMPFAVMGSVLVAIGLLSIFIVPVQPEGRGGESKSIWPLLKIPGIIISSLSIAIGSMTIGFYEPTLELHIDDLVSSPLDVGLIFLASAGTYALTAPLWGIAADMIRNPKVLTIAGASLVAVAFTLLGPVPFLRIELQLWLVIVALVIHGFGLGGLLVPPLKDNLAQAIDHGYQDNSDTRGLVAGLFMSLFSLGAFLGPAVGGSLVSVIGFEWSAFVVACITLLLSVVTVVHLAIRWRADYRRRATYVPIEPRHSMRG